MELNSIVLTGTMSEICEKLAEEAQGCKGMPFVAWLQLRKHEKQADVKFAHLSEAQNTYKPAKDLTTSTLHKAVDYIVNSNEDICQICAYLRPWTVEEMEEAARKGEMPCRYHKTNGKTACRNGIIEHFQKEALKDQIFLIPLCRNVIF